MSQTIMVNCPTCHAPVLWQPESVYRPFCSGRCRLVDLGAWADEQHTIASPPSMADDE